MKRWLLLAPTTLACCTAPPRQTLQLTPCTIPRTSEPARCGTLEVFENRITRTGRKILLYTLVVPSRRQPALSDPVFVLVGGPGQPATSVAMAMLNSSMRDERDVVLVDVRGTGASNLLQCPPRGNDAEVQGYFEPYYTAQNARSCREQLEPHADLRFYGNTEIVDDLDDVRIALGYRTINLWGASGGTRTGLVYLARHPASIRSAIFVGVAPFQLRNPLWHAAAAQQAFDRLAMACAADAFCGREYPALNEKLRRVIARLAAAPVPVTIRHAITTAPVQISLTREAFADGLRLNMYGPNARFIPALVDEAARGNFSPAAQMALARFRTPPGTPGAIAMGSLLSVTCTEDVSRIRPTEIPSATAGTFLGDGRVRGQIAACSEWPKGELPAWVNQPVRSNVPALLISGRYDPVTPQQWADSAATHMSNVKHVVFDAPHAIQNACTEDLIRRFLAAGSGTNLDVSCVAAIQLPPFARRDELPRAP